MISDQQMESVLGHIQQAKYLLRKADAEGHPASTAAREHLAACTTELENLREGASLHVPEGNDRTLPELAGDVGKLLSLLAGQHTLVRSQIDQLGNGGLPVKDLSLEDCKEADLEMLLSTLSQLRRRASGTEADLRLLKLRLEEEERRSN